jgi:hypothetical protein
VSTELRESAGSSPLCERIVNAATVQDAIQDSILEGLFTLIWLDSELSGVDTKFTERNPFRFGKPSRWALSDGARALPVCSCLHVCKWHSTASRSRSNLVSWGLHANAVYRRRKRSLGVGSALGGPDICTAVTSHCELHPIAYSSAPRRPQTPTVEHHI